MSLDRLPGCRAPRQEDHSTSAFSHPELLSGYLAIRPVLRPSLSPGDRASYVTWSARSVVVTVVAIATIIGWPMLQAAFEGALPNFNVMTARLGW
jgi:hypothetical protein